MHVLICEDNPVSLHVLNVQFTKLLKKISPAETHQIDVTKLGKEALNLSRQHYYDMIVLDIHLPDIGGWDLARTIRMQQREPSQINTIIGVSAYDILEIDASAPFDHFINKPVTLPVLEKLLRQKINTN